MKVLFGHALVGVAALALLASGARPAWAQQTWYVDVLDCYEFSPGDFTINQGDTVIWVWQSGTHSTTSEDGLWDSGVHDTGCPPYQFQYTFNDVGDYLYDCTVHGVTAEIHVVAACGGGGGFGAWEVASNFPDRPAGVALLAVGLCGCGL
jgi:plastocyanin